MAGASSHMLNFLSGGGVPEGRVYGRRLVFVSVRTIKRHHHHVTLDADARWGRLPAEDMDGLESLESRNDSKKKVHHLRKFLLIQRWAVEDAAP